MNKETGNREGQKPDTRRKIDLGEDNEGHLYGSTQHHFNEQKAQEVERRGDDSELNKKDDRGEVKGTERI